MPRFVPNLRDANAGVLVLEDGDYLFEIGQPKVFARQNRDGNDVYGVSYGLTVKEGPSNVGKTVPVQCFLHTSGALDMSKRFALAALGYNPNDATDEQRFNDSFPDEGEAFGIDTDDNHAGEVWQKIGGANIEATVKQQMSRPKDGSAPRLQNQFGWRPIG